MESKLWDGNFCHISLYSSLEHLPSDISCIKTSLIYMARYIENKKFDMTKSNEVKDLQDIGKAAWKFVFAFYKAGWDSLVTDIYNNTFKQNISFYCTLKTNPVKSGKSKEKDTDKLASIERLPPPIPTKTFKEVNEISNFFRTKILAQANVSQGKSYMQASRTGSNTENILKIKEAFPTLKTKNINNIQQMIKGDSKSKPHINKLQRTHLGNRSLFP